LVLVNSDFEDEDEDENEKLTSLGAIPPVN